MEQDHYMDKHRFDTDANQVANGNPQGRAVEKETRVSESLEERTGYIYKIRFPLWILGRQIRNIDGKEGIRSSSHSETLIK